MGRIRSPAFWRSSLAAELPEWNFSAGRVAELQAEAVARYRG